MSNGRTHLARDLMSLERTVAMPVSEQTRCA
jgi:hypothetical protein